MNFTTIVATCGRKSVVDTIKSLKEQTHPTEIIAVIDGSDIKIDLPNDVKVIKHERPLGLAVCRNDGVRASSTQIVSFIDDDAYAHPRWIEELERSFMEGYDIVGGLILPLFEKSPPFWFNQHFFALIAINQFTGHIYGCNFAVRRSIFERVKYFKPELGRRMDNLIAGDESELFFRATEKGLKITRNDAAIVYHLVPKERLSLSYISKRMFWEGVTEGVRGRAKSHFSAYLITLISDLVKYLVRAFLLPVYLWGILYGNIKRRKLLNKRG